MHGGITVRGFTANAWELLRTLRLAALLESPAAFASTRKEEAELPEHVWRQRASRLAVAFCDGQPVGLVGVIESEGHGVMQHGAGERETGAHAGGVTADAELQRVLDAEARG